MSSSHISLIVISGLGTVHGLFLAVFLWSYQKGDQLSNRLLSALLLILTFRIGKSVFLEFADDIAVELIFTGLGSILAIGPLFYLFAQSCCDNSFHLKQKHLLHFLPSLAGISFGLWLNNELIESIPKLFLAGVFLAYYFHFLSYLIISLRFIKKQKSAGKQDSTIKLLNLLVYGLFALWVVYFLNLIDEIVPYIFGPVLYSIVAYVISFIVIKEGYLQEIHKSKYKTTSVSEEKSTQLFEKVKIQMKMEKQFKNPEVSLKSLSKTLKVTPQVLSMTINQKTGKNFNAFINHYRIEEAAKLLTDDEFSSHTISAIAYEVGFNSISSFNTNFKAQTGKTPAAHRKG
jgi:AraC-like DNA-binding protein